jgi:hypothetical protein
MAEVGRAISAKIEYSLAAGESRDANGKTGWQISTSQASHGLFGDAGRHRQRPKNNVKACA